jgi:hypothetical protein
MYILTGLLRRLRRVALLQRKGSELVSLLLGDISSKGALADVETSSVLPLIRTLGKTYHYYAPWGLNGTHARTHHRTRTRKTRHDTQVIEGCVMMVVQSRSMGRRGTR